MEELENLRLLPFRLLDKTVQIKIVKEYIKYRLGNTLGDTITLSGRNFNRKFGLLDNGNDFQAFNKALTLLLLQVYTRNELKARKKFIKFKGTGTTKYILERKKLEQLF